MVILELREKDAITFELVDKRTGITLDTHARGMSQLMMYKASGDDYQPFTVADLQAEIFEEARQRCELFASVFQVQTQMVLVWK